MPIVRQGSAPVAALHCKQTSRVQKRSVLRLIHAFYWQLKGLNLAHNYKKYVHLEGLVEEDPFWIATPDGQAVRFTLAVIETSRDSVGNIVKIRELFLIEVGTKQSKYAGTLKKGMPVSVDATLKSKNNNAEQVARENLVAIRAHRILGIDYSGWKRDGMN